MAQASEPARNVRPRLDSGASSSAAPVVSPLIALMDSAVVDRRMVKDSYGEVYTGFANYCELARSQCAFVPMNSNRAINREVVRQRVLENIEAYDQHGRYLEFGQINLLIVVNDPSHDFLVMDGQHRCETMRSLHSQNPDRPLWFQFRAKVLPSEELAFAELRHFQRSYPTDSRSFFRSRAETRLASAILEKLKEAHAGAFRGMVLSDRQGRGTGDPPRPYLNDNLIYWILQDSGLAAPSADSTAVAPFENGGARCILRKLRMVDQALSTLALAQLGKGATENMRQVARRIGCWLGFFREGYLQWRDVANQLDLSDVAAPEERPSSAATQQMIDCVVCLEQPAVSALLPCGHKCVCEVCGSAVCAARPPKCPLCRGDITGKCRIFG